jgi:hypothetical protein
MFDKPEGFQKGYPIMGGAVCVGSNLYCIRSMNSGDNIGMASAIAVVPNYESGSVDKNSVKYHPIYKTGTTLASLAHANGICYAHNHFLVVTAYNGITNYNCRIAAVTTSPPSGTKDWCVEYEINVKDTMGKPKAVTSITKLTDLADNTGFIIGSDDHPAGKRKFYKITINKNAKSVTIDTSMYFTISIGEGYKGNDICCYNNKLYVPVFFDSDPLLQNKVYEIDMTNVIFDGGEYLPTRVLIDNGAANIKKYEIEGISVGASAKNMLWRMSTTM